MPRYEFVEGSSSKFWEIAVDGKSLTVRWGRIGTDGQSQAKRLGSPDAAKREHDKLVAEKLKKGYRLVGAGAKARGGKAKAAAAGGAAEPAPDPDRDHALPGARRWNHPTKKTFVELVLDGERTLLRREGKIGTAGKVTKKTFRQGWEARNAVRGLELRSKGFEPYTPPVVVAPSLEDPAQVAPIVAHPDDEQAYLVYGDWLQSQGDPRGELIALMHAGKKKAAARWIARHAPSLLGPLQPYATRLDGEEKPAFEWHLGFIRSALFSFDYYSDESRGIVPMERAVEALLTHPSGRVLRALTFGLNRRDPDCSYGAMLEALAKHGAPALQSLHVADFQHPDTIEMSWTELGSFAQVWKAVPRLERLIVQGGSFTLGNIELPELKHAELRTGGLTRASAKSIAEAKWPKLESLEVWFGSHNYGGDCRLADMRPLLDGAATPHLRHLGLRNCEVADEIAAALPTAKVLPRLRTLDLSMGTLSDDGAAHLVKHRAAFAHLEALDLSRSYLSAGTTRALKTVCKKVIVDRQQQADEYDGQIERYVSVGE